jgi:putative SOS response-associated peptidase YedK
VVLNEPAADDWTNPLGDNPLSLKRVLLPAPNDSLVASLASQLVKNVKNDVSELSVGAGRMTR